MVAKKESITANPKAKNVQNMKLKKHAALAADVFLFRRRTDLGRDLLFIKKADEKEVFFSNSKRFYRRKTDIESCKDLTDNELIEVIQNQNHQAYVDLFRRYQKKLFLYIYRLIRDRDETEDILQNVFAKAYKNIQHFDLERKFSSWIYRIAHNEAVNYLKRKSKRYIVSWEDVTTSKDKLETASNEEPIEDQWLHQEIAQEIGEALKKLPKQYRQILNMRYFKEYSYEQISKILGKPVNTVGTIINRAKKKLFEIVKGEAQKREQVVLRSSNEK